MTLIGATACAGMDSFKRPQGRRSLLDVLSLPQLDDDAAEELMPSPPLAARPEKLAPRRSSKTLASGRAAITRSCSPRPITAPDGREVALAVDSRGLEPTSIARATAADAAGRVPSRERPTSSNSALNCNKPSCSASVEDEGGQPRTPAPGVHPQSAPALSPAAEARRHSVPVRAHASRKIRNDLDEERRIATKPSLFESSLDCTAVDDGPGTLDLTKDAAYEFGAPDRYRGIHGYNAVAADRSDAFYTHGGSIQTGSSEARAAPARRPSLRQPQLSTRGKLHPLALAGSSITATTSPPDIRPHAPASLAPVTGRRPSLQVQSASPRGDRQSIVTEGACSDTQTSVDLVASRTARRGSQSHRSDVEHCFYARRSMSEEPVRTSAAVSLPAIRIFPELDREAVGKTVCLKGWRQQVAMAATQLTEPISAPLGNEFKRAAFEAAETYIVESDYVFWNLLDVVGTRLSTDLERAAVDAVNELLALGKRVLFVTNGVTSACLPYTQKLLGKGLALPSNVGSVSRDRAMLPVITVGRTCAWLLGYLGKRRPFVITSSPGFLEDLRDNGIVDYVSTISDTGEPIKAYSRAVSAQSVAAIVAASSGIDAVVLGVDTEINTTKVAVASMYLSGSSQ